MFSPTCESVAVARQPHGIRPVCLVIAVALMACLAFTLARPARAQDKGVQLFLPSVGNNAIAIGQTLDGPAVGYATAPDRTLIRWYWHEEGAPTFRVYRSLAGEPEHLLAEVSAIGNPVTIANILDTTDPAWPNLSADLVAQFAQIGVTDLLTLQSFLSDDRFVAQQLANEYYPVALVIGWGYLDLDAQPGQVYTYRVEALTPDQPTDLGIVEVLTGQLTPLIQPVGLVDVEMAPGLSAHALPRNGDWATVQRNRRFHQSVYLRWDQNAENEGPAGAWVSGYDVYLEQDGGYQHISPPEAVRPMPASQPISETTPTTGTVPYEQIDFFYSHSFPLSGDYTFRVAPRDLLGQVRQWPQDASQFSDPLTATTHDFLPPPTPYNLTATPLQNNSGVSLTWIISPALDLDHFRIERTLTFTNPPQFAGCASAADCWFEVATVGAQVNQWTDADATQEIVRWYRLQAVDTDENRSNYAGPVQAVLHDITAPAPPGISVDTCSTSIGGICLWGGSADPDTTRLRVACRLSQTGEELLLDEVEGSQLFDYDVLSNVYAPPLTLTDVECSVYAVDAHGNVSGPATVNLPQINSPLPPQVGQPLITQIDTLGSGSDLTARVHWDLTDSPLIEGFRIERRDISDETDPLSKLVGPEQRQYDDPDVEVGRTYLYSVTALIHFSGLEKESLPRLYRATEDGRRVLEKIPWLVISWSGSTGTTLVWNACEITTDPPFKFAVFRSLYPDRDFNQITTVMEYSPCDPLYIDASASHDHYWYVVVQMDPRTGEPIGYTEPGEVASHVPPPAASPPSYVPQNLMHSRLQNTVYQSSNGLALLPCSAVAPDKLDQGTILTFGGGFTLEIGSASADAISHRINGSGTLHMQPGGQPLEIPVTFTNVTVGDSDNKYVCNTGSLTHISFADLIFQTVQVTQNDGISYSVIGLTLQSWFHPDNRAWGDITINLPETIRSVNQIGDESPRLRLAGEDLRLDRTLAFSYEAELDDIPGHSCSTPIYSWRLETLPVTVVPLGNLRIDNTPSSANLVTSDTSCMRYFERYTGIPTPRPTPTDVSVADSNDGLLRGQYQAGETVVDADGLHASYTTQDDMAWIAGYPYAFNTSITGDVNLTLADSRIVSGTIGAGAVQMAYHQKADGTQAEPLHATFAQATIEAGGAIYAQVQTADSVAWLTPGGFRVDPGAWEFYAGPLTTPGLPAGKDGDVAHSVMWAARPGATTPIEVPSGVSLPGELDPGLSRRLVGDNLHWGNCCGPEVTFTASLDLYVRRGGVSGRFVAQIPGPIFIPIYGYDGRLDHFEFAFLDNVVWDSNVTGEIDLPFPSNITLRLVDIWLAGDGCGACLGGGIVPPDQRDKLLEYWQVDVSIRTVEFHPDGDDPEPVCEKLLVANGTMTLPHLSEPGQPGPAALDMELVFLADGMAVPHIVAYTRGDYQFDSFPYLLEEVRLSDVGEQAGWEANATLDTPPAVDWSQRGFVALQGAFAARYFGLLEGQTEGPQNRPEVRFQAWDGGYVGFPESLVAAKVWVDLEIVEVAWRYDRLLYAVDGAETPAARGNFAAFRRYEFLPGNVIEDLRMVHLDTSIVLEPDRLNIFAGLSSGTALLRFLAEVSGGAQPSDEQTNAWGTKLDLNHSGDYQALLGAVWPTFAGQTFHDITTVLDDYDDQPNQDLPNNDDFGGGTGGFLADAGVQFNRVRGDIQFIDAGDPGKIQIDQFAMSCEVNLLRQGEAGALLYVERLGFEINRHGDYILEALGVSSRLYASDLTLDATLRINPSLPQFEGGLSLHNFDISTVRVIEGSAALGVGAEVNYVGVTFTGSFSSGPTGGSGTMGGSFLAGTINPASPVLQNHFGEVVNKLSEMPSSPDNDAPPSTLNGLYLRMYGDATLWNDGGLLQVNGGGEIAAWLWVENIEEFTEIPDNLGDATDLLDYVTFGGKYRYFIHGKIITVVSARGDITFIYWDRPIPGGDGLENIINRDRSLTGIAWIAGGIGLCDSQTWTSWETRWWDDSWCWTAGAYLEATVNLEGVNPQGLDLDVSWDADYE